MNQLSWKHNKTYVINSTSFLSFIDSPNGLRNLKFVESTVFEIIRGVGSTPFVEGVGTKYLSTGRVKDHDLYSFPRKKK